MQDVDINTVSKLRHTYVDISADTQTLIPRIYLNLNVQHLMPAGQPIQQVIIKYSRGELRLISNEGTDLYAGIFVPDQSFYSLSSGATTSSRLYADLDYYRLAKIEELREGKDLQIRIILFFETELLEQPKSKRSQTIQLEGRIPKSDWVEKFLPRLKYKDTSLIEIPKIERPEYNDVVAKINESWKKYSMGEYDKVLTECRKAVEGLSSIIKKNFKKELVDKEGKKKTVPDWEKALEHKEMGNIVETIIQKLFGFFSPSAHYGKSTNREDAELAIMMTHGLVNFISKKVKIQVS